MAKPPDIDIYVERLIEEKGYPSLSPALHEQIKKDLLERLNDTINARIITAMTDEQVEGFSALLNTDPSTEEIQHYIAKCIPDGADFMARVLLDFRKTYLGLG